MTLSKGEKVHGIIHTAAASTAAIGGGLAQIPGSDIVPITAIQIGMISAIALVHGRKLTEATATAVLGTFSAGMFGRAISQLLVGWIPGAGNAINASTAATLTEAIGWSAHKFFEHLGEEQLTQDELIARARADITMSAQERNKQAGFLRRKGLLHEQEALLAFYNNALISPLFSDDHTNTCMFVTDVRVVQVKKGVLDQAVALTEVADVQVEHNFTFLRDDYVIVIDRAGMAHRFTVIRHEIGKGMQALIKGLSDQKSKGA